MSNAILRLPMVMDRTGLSRSSIYLRQADGSFPRSLSIGARCRSLQSEIEEWIQERLEQSRRAIERA